MSCAFVAPTRYQFASRLARNDNVMIRYLVLCERHVAQPIYMTQASLHDRLLVCANESANVSGQRLGQMHAGVLKRALACAQGASKTQFRKYFQHLPRLMLQMFQNAVPSMLAA
eukprot:4652688-Pleurochrysis_carterae.AAC.1